MAKRRSFATPSQRWALAVSLPHAAAHGERLDDFKTDPKTAQAKLLAAFPQLDRYNTREQLEQRLSATAPRLAPYDLSRYVNAARWACALGWLTAPQAWQLLMSAARRTQREYGGWEQFAQQAAASFATTTNNPEQRKRVTAALDALSKPARRKRDGVPDWE
jgi:hypothetical protein